MGAKDNSDKADIERDDQKIWVEVIEALKKTERKKDSPNQQIDLNITRDNNDKKRTNKLSR